MFLSIFNYIEHLFTMIQPKKTFFMAIDGVAPRAKMNQQRARRFRTALDAEKSRKKALDEGLELPTTDPFDSNCITPGTEFMEKLTVQLQYFIHKKVSEDSQWQNIDIILSSHEVPGEGEHKIMEKIRSERARPGYDSNTRHCLYGLDADLIMLGLVSHDPHFALLREEVTFGRSKKIKELAEQNFFLLHLSLVREYLEMEFDDIKDKLPFDFDFERVLDDFILLNFFVGNDFLPELPSLHINEGALPLVISTYKRVIQSSDGYLTHEGVINLERLGDWLKEMSKFELEKFEESAVDLEWFNEDLEPVSLKGQQKQKNKLSLTARQKEILRELKPFLLSANEGYKPKDGEAIPSQSLNRSYTEDDLKFVQTFVQQANVRMVSKSGTKTLLLDLDGIPDTESEDEHNDRLLGVHRLLKKHENAPTVKESEVDHKEEVYNVKFEAWKSRYYKEKFAINVKESPEIVKDIATNYIEGLQWVLFYYYRGVASWGWFYRYHYAPRISDMKLGLDYKINFDLGTPFRPFEQLMGVLPGRSKALVPQAYWSLMLDDTSPIKDFYPNDFELDMNGKKNDWEAIVKIPFVDQNRLLAAMETKRQFLSPAEVRRNSFGNNLRFHFNPQQDSVYPSSLPGVFLNIEHNHCIEEILEKQLPDSHKLVFGLLKGAKLGVNALAGFPSLKTLPIKFEIKKANVQVFQMSARNESIVLSLNKPRFDDSESVTELAEQILGTTVYIGWPYLREAKVVNVSDELFKYESGSRNIITSIPHAPKEVDKWSQLARKVQNDYSRKGVEIGRVSALVHVHELRGLKRTPQGSFVKDFGPSKTESHQDSDISYPVQILVENVANEDDRFIERPALPVSEEYPLDSQAIFLGPAGYGNPVTIKSHHGDNLDVQLMKLERGEPGIGHRSAQAEREFIHYLPSFEVANFTHLHPLFLSRITSKFFVKVGEAKFDVGLNLKFEAKRLKVLGYSRRGLRGWEFSNKAIDLIQAYTNTFPDIHGVLVRATGNDLPEMSSLLKVTQEAAKARLTEVRKWLKAKTVENPQFESVSLETEGLSQISVRKIETYIISYFQNPEPVKVILCKGVPRASLLAPSYAYHSLRSQKFQLGDRVVSALNYGKVKLFNRGTVVGINSLKSKVTLDVLFDVEFEAGNTLGGLLTTNRGLSVDAGSVVNLSNRQLVYQNKGAAPTSPRQTHHQPIKPKQPHLSAVPIVSAWSKPKDAPKAPAKASAKASAKARNSNGTSKQDKAAKPSPKVILKRTESSAATGPTDTVPNDASDEKARKDLLAMLHGTEPEKDIKQSEEDLVEKSNKSLKNIKKTTNPQSQRNLIGAVYGQFAANPYGSGMIPPPPPPPQFAAYPPVGFSGHMPPFPPPPMGYPANLPPPFTPPYPVNNNLTFDENASAQLMAHLNIGTGGPAPTESPETSESHFEGHGPRRGNNNGRGGRGGRGHGRGRGRGGRGNHGANGTNEANP